MSIRSFRVDDDLWQLATERARSQSTTVTAVLVAALERYVADVAVTPESRRRAIESVQASIAATAEPASRPRQGGKAAESRELAATAQAAGLTVVYSCCQHCPRKHPEGHDSPCRQGC